MLRCLSYTCLYFIVTVIGTVCNMIAMAGFAFCLHSNSCTSETIFKKRLKLHFLNCLKNGIIFYINVIYVNIKTLHQLLDYLELFNLFFSFSSLDDWTMDYKTPTCLFFYPPTYLSYL